MKQILLTNNRICLLDDEDYEQFKHINWYATANNYVISRRNISKGGTLWLHRLILNCPIDKVVDHINGNRLDNRKINLRICTSSQNNQNSKKKRFGRSSSKYKGVYYDKQHNKFRVRIYVDGKHKHLGLFTKEIEAANIYDQAAKKYYKEFAKLNEQELS